MVVIAGEPDLEAIKQHAPAAVLVFTKGDSDVCKAAYETTLFPRARIIGASDPAPIVESVLFDRRDEHEVTAMADGEFSQRRARIGRAGISELL